MTSTELICDPVDTARYNQRMSETPATPARRTNGGAGGRPRALNEEIIGNVVAVVRQGVPWHYCASTAGVSTRTIYYWMDRGETETNRLLDDPDATPSDDEAIYADFYMQVTHAYQTAVQRNLMYMQQSARGGYVTEESTRKNRDGSVETTVKKTAPDWRAAAKFLQYADKSRFGDGPQQVEVTGRDGGAIEVVGLPAIAARIAARQQAVENVVDAEVVEND